MKESTKNQTHCLRNSVETRNIETGLAKKVSKYTVNLAWLTSPKWKLEWSTWVSVYLWFSCRIRTQKSSIAESLKCLYKWILSSTSISQYCVDLVGNWRTTATVRKVIIWWNALWIWLDGQEESLWNCVFGKWEFSFLYWTWLPMNELFCSGT